MISFYNLQQQKQRSLTFVPQALLAEVRDNLTNVNVKHTVYDYTSFTTDISPLHLKPEYTQVIEEARDMYKTHGYTNTTCMAAICCRIQPDALFDAICQLFGPNEDMDHRMHRMAVDKHAATTLQNQLKSKVIVSTDTVIPVKAR